MPTSLVRSVAACRPALALLAALGLPAAEVIEAGPASPVATEADKGATGIADEAPKQPKNEFVVIPTPSYNPTVGAMLTVMAMYAYRPDPAQAKPWTAGLAGFGAQNGSWGAFAFNRAVLADDTWRVMAVAGYVDVRYDYYGVGDSPLQDDPVELRQRVAIAGGKVLRECTDNLYLGPVANLRSIRVSAVDGPIAGAEAAQSIGGLGLGGEYDTRDQDFKPHAGWFVQAQWVEQFASDVSIGPVETDGPSYGTAYLRVNRYQPLAESTTLGLRSATQYASASTPFYDLPTLGGGSKDLRGYSGEYRDRVMAAVQAEVRQDLPYRFGVVGFAGIGAVEETYADLIDSSLHPSLGTGLRYLVATENRINAALDFAWGDQGWAWYLSAGEAF
jgi:hypothetical protein